VILPRNASIGKALFSSSVARRKGERTSLSRPASWTLAVDLAEREEEEASERRERASVYVEGGREASSEERGSEGGREREGEGLVEKERKESKTDLAGQEGGREDLGLVAGQTSEDREADREERESVSRGRKGLDGGATGLEGGENEEQSPISAASLRALSSFFA